ncbi:DUF6415 family natural product biosynthesis protein [Streptomyces lushanensis]|uniref:DUF6415 family natural product biosynthesis protein n=1 Tax=Streptomyces lushanensis TaxID=1434255 RepID=UPI000829A65F|nr:DUF6415 family natural product biosynthesis protein [Streptomyces lushanensis]
MGRQTDATSAARSAIDRARGVGYRAGTHEELDLLATDLRAYVTEMLPVAQAQAERMWHGSREWYVLNSRLHSISTEAEQPLATGTLAAHVQVRLLALDCEWLLTHFATTHPTHGPAPSRRPR